MWIFLVSEETIFRHIAVPYGGFYVAIFICASNEPKSVLARDPGDCRDNQKELAKRVFYD